MFYCLYTFITIFRPQLFDFDALIRKDVNSRLEHAFQIAYKYLGIDKLLDPEGINNLFNFIIDKYSKNKFS